jgi:hypothetical protein
MPIYATSNWLGSSSKAYNIAPALIGTSSPTSAGQLMREARLSDYYVAVQVTHDSTVNEGASMGYGPPC